jgi:hypothetical protein
MQPRVQFLRRIMRPADHLLEDSATLRDDADKREISINDSIHQNSSSSKLEYKVYDFASKS